jgi:type 1 glutamine amidotransferase
MLRTLTAITLLALAAAHLPAQLPPEERQKIEAALPKAAPARPAQPRKLLVINLDIWKGKVRRGHASVPHGNLALELMGRATGAYEAVFSSDAAVVRPENLRQFHAVCFNNTTGVLFTDPDLKRSLMEFIRGGGGFVGIHAAAATFVEWPDYSFWPEFGEMLGGYEDGGHPWKPHETITLRVEDPKHPLNAGFPQQSFEISDEVFQFRSPYSRERVRVLLSIDPVKTDTGPNRRILPQRRQDLDFPISWIRREGQGRVFYTALGHNTHIFWNPPVLAHILAGIQFVLGDLKADTTPRPQPASRP